MLRGKLTSLLDTNKREVEKTKKSEVKVEPRANKQSKEKKDDKKEKKSSKKK